MHVPFSMTATIKTTRIRFRNALTSVPSGQAMDRQYL